MSKQTAAKAIDLPIEVKMTAEEARLDNQKTTFKIIFNKKNKLCQ
jgi:hypothetical protein